MRDPKRIDQILDLIKRRWEECPDLRFFQLLRLIFGSFSVVYAPDLFHQEDDITKQILEQGK